MIKADLHVHSLRSDGSDKREEILEEAKRIGLTHIAFTEHDSTQYVDEGVLLGRLYGINVIPALEISAFDFQTGKKVHILGYHFQTRYHIDALCRDILQQRHKNGLRQIKILQSLGYAIDLAKVISLVGGGCLYKQHILSYLVETKQTEALFGKVYQQIFKNGGSCDFDITYVRAEDAVKAIVADHGYAVLAHPGQQQNLSIVSRLVPLGLKGIELHHPSHSDADKMAIQKMMKEYHLFCTGGSDFHGIYEANANSLGSEISPENPLISKIWDLI